MSIALLRPERAAHATLRGYLYQVCLGVLRWLQLGPNEILLCEGDEDLDRRILGGGGISEQVKVSSASLGLSDRVVRDSLCSFLLSYVALCQQGETRKFRFTTNAPARRPRYGFDLLAAWRGGDRGPEVVAGVRHLLARYDEVENPKRREDIAAALLWLDRGPDGWPGFLEAVEWTFREPDLDEIRRTIQEHLRQREDARHLPADLLTDRLIAAVFDASARKDVRERILTPTSLSGLLEAARDGLGLWERTPEARNLRGAFDELREMRLLLDDGTRGLPADPSPGKLLTAAYEVIPFDETGRSEELAFLAGWCREETPRSALVIAGDGGSGKTRLMIEWCRRLRHQGWHAGFLRWDRTGRDLDPFFEGANPRLIALDYAETRLGLVETLLLKAALDRKTVPKVRIVLLARHAGDWWDGLSQAPGAVEDLILGSPGPWELAPLLPDPDQRTRAFQEAFERFGRQLGREMPQDLPAPDLSEPELERVLYLHMAALTALEGGPGEGTGDAVAKTLRHEREYWRHRIGDLRLDGARNHQMGRAVELAVASLTLTQGAADETRARALLERALEPLQIAQDLFESLLVLLRDLYGVPGEPLLAPLQPDLLGERLVEEVLGREGRLVSRLIRGADRDEISSCLTVLARLAARQPEAKTFLEETLREHLDAVVEEALSVASTAGGPLGEILAEEIERQGSIELADRVDHLCRELRFRDSVELQEVALAALKALLRKLPAAASAERARVENDLGLRLGALGRLTESLQAAQNAVAAFRALAETDPGQRPHLGGSLNNLSNALRALGRTEEALSAIAEAAQIFDRLAQEHWEIFLPPLASALGNLGTTFSEAGLEKEALKALRDSVELLRVIAVNNEDFLPEMAGSLLNLAGMLSDNGKRKEALRTATEAVELYLRLAEERPGSFLPDLAHAMNAYSRALTDRRRYKEALEVAQNALAIHRQLARARPEVFASGLSMSLNNLSVILGKVGRIEEAFAAAQESVETVQPLFFLHPEALAESIEISVLNYLQSAERLGVEPDRELLAPIQALLESTFE